MMNNFLENENSIGDGREEDTATARAVAVTPIDVDTNANEVMAGSLSRIEPISATGAVPPPQASPSSILCSATDQLERCGRWLSSIPRDDVTALRDTPEYQEFLHAFERLGHAHRRVITCDNRTETRRVNSPMMNATINSPQSDTMLSGTSPNSSSIATSTNGRVNQNDLEAQRVQVHAAISDFVGANIPSALTAAISAANRVAPHHDAPSLTINAFLQHTDDVILRVFEFLECQSLIRASLTCSRFHQLAHRGATQRTFQIARTRQLDSVMRLLRAHEQIVQGDHTNHAAVGHVRVPMLLLGRRIIVTNAGDPEYNGVYYCTNANGNGFVFTKPRYPIQRVSDRMGRRWQQHGSEANDRRQREDTDMENRNLEIPVNNQDNDNNNGGNPVIVQDGLQRQHIRQLHLHQGRRVRIVLRQNQNPARIAVAVQDRQQQPQQQQPPGAVAGQILPQNDNFSSTRYDGEDIQPGQPLRCIISKRFSNETILWYMSKEVEVGPPADSDEAVNEDENEHGGIREVFSYWSKLMVLGAASPDICRYPSQTSILSRQGDGWQSLALTMRPPTVELLD
jgi:hypothetical protein